MKRLSSLIPILALVLVFTADAFGQAASTTINASATIENAITFSTETDMSFGQIPANFSGVSIIPTQGGTPTFNNTGTGQQQGEVVIDSGSGTASLLVTVNNPTTLTSSTTPSDIGFTANYVGEDGTDLSSASDASVSTTDDGDSNNDYAIYLGGSLDDPGNGGTDGTLDAEQHTGTITINVDFQ